MTDRRYSRKRVVFCTLADGLTELEISRLTNVIADVSERDYYCTWSTAARRPMAPLSLRPPTQVDFGQEAFRWMGKTASDEVDYSLLIFEGPEPDSVLINEAAHAVTADRIVFMDERFDHRYIEEVIDEVVACLDVMYDGNQGWAAIGPERLGYVDGHRLTNAEARSMAGEMDLLVVDARMFRALGGIPAHPEVSDRFGLAHTLLGGVAGKVLPPLHPHQVRHSKNVPFLEKRRAILTNGASWSPEIDGLSVLMPIGPNATSTLRDAVRSIAAQRVDVPVQLCVSFDGTPFDARKADIKRVLRLAEKAGIEVSFKANGKQFGVAATRNASLEDAKYGLVWFADADDCAIPGSYQLMVGAMRSNPEAGWMVGGSKFWEPATEGKPAWLASDQALTEANRARMPTLNPRSVAAGGLSPLFADASTSLEPVMVMRRELALLFGGCGALGMHEDWYLYLAMDATPGLNAMCDLRLYRNHSGQMTRQQGLSGGAALSRRSEQASKLAVRVRGPVDVAIASNLEAGGRNAGSASVDAIVM